MFDYSIEERFVFEKENHKRSLFMYAVAGDRKKYDELKKRLEKYFPNQFVSYETARIRFLT